MEMLTRLHQRGYQRLRLSSGISPTGLNWRYAIAPADDFEPNGYRLTGGMYPGVAFGTTRGDDAPFGWEDAQDLSPDQLAERFVESFPAAAAAGLGTDLDYAAWLVETLAVCRPAGAPIMFGEYVDPVADGHFGVGDEKRVPLPPRLGPDRSGKL